MKNIIPRKPSITDFLVLGQDQIRISHSDLVDYDAAYVVVYIYVVTIGTSNYASNYVTRNIYAAAKEDRNSIIVPLPSINSTQEYVIEVATIDDLANGVTTSGSDIDQYDREGNFIQSIDNSFITDRNVSALLISDPIRLSAARGAYLTSVIEVVPDSISNSAPPYLALDIEPSSGNMDYINIEVGTGFDGSTLNNINWVSVYSSNYQDYLQISSGLTTNSNYVFRVSTVFKDGSVSDYEYYDSNTATTTVNQPLITVGYGTNISKPNDFSVGNITAEAFTSWDGTPTYELLLKWTYTESSPVRHFEIQYLKDNSINNSTALSALNWSDPFTYTVASSSDRLIISAIEYGARYGFRFRAVGYGSSANKYSDWEYKKVAIGNDTSIAFDIIPANHTAPVGTNIQVNDAFIRAYNDWGGPEQAVTFEIDAATGNVSIGDGSSFLYDAGNSRLSIDGSVITDNITAASFVMDWLGGVAPSLRTANKAGFADGGSGLWAGYSDSNTFQFDIGDDSSYLRWDGSDLSIYGGVTIVTPNDPSVLQPGSIGYTTVSMSASNNIVVFDGTSGSIQEDVSISVNVSTNGDSNFISNLVWEVLDPDDNDITSTALSSGTTNANKFIDVTSANNILKTYDKIRVRVWFDPQGSGGSLTYDTATIKDYTVIGKVKTYDSIAGLEDPFYVYLTNEVQAVPVDESSQNPYLNDATGGLRIYQGSTNLTNNSNTTYSVSNADGCTVNLVGSQFTVTAIPLSGGVPTKDTYNIEFNINYDPDNNGGVDYAVVFSLFISKQGASGQAGSDGESSRLYNSFETTTNQNKVGNGANASFQFTTADARTGTTSLLASATYDSGTVTPQGSGSGDTIYIEVPNSLRDLFQGHDVIIEVFAKQGPTTPTTSFGMVYSTNSIGNSGWSNFTAQSDWTKHSFEYSIPVGGNTSTDYIIINPDITGGGGELRIDTVSVFIKPEKGDTGDVPTITVIDANTYEISNGVDTITINDGEDGLPPTIVRNTDGTYTIDNGIDDPITISDGYAALPYDISPAQFGGSGNLKVHYNYTVDANNDLTYNAGDLAIQAEQVFIHPTLGELPIVIPITILTNLESTGSDATGTFYLVYSNTLAYTRFPSITADMSNNNVIPVMYNVTDNKWYVITNSPTTTGTVEFVLEATDCFVGTFFSESGSTKIDGYTSYINYSPIKGIDYFDGVDGAYVSTVFRVTSDGVNPPATPVGGSLVIESNGSLTETPPTTGGVSCTLEPTYNGNGAEWKSTTRYYKDSNGNYTNAGWSPFSISSQVGADAKSLILSADSYVFKYDKDGGYDIGDQIILTAQEQNLTGSFSWSTSPTVSLGGSATASSRALNIANFGSNNEVAITVSKDGLSDTVRIVRVQDGPTGEDGADAYTVVLTNEAHTIPTDVNGDNQNLSGTGCTVRVFKGATQLQPQNTSNVSNLLANRFDLRLTNALSGMNRSYSGNDIIVSDATSGPSTDIRQVTYTIYIRPPDGGSNITINKTQTFTKAKQGVKGDTGVGQQGTRAPVFIEGATTANPTTSSPWSGGTGSTAYSVFVGIMGNIIAYDILTLYNSSNPALVDTYMWNGSGWETAVKIHGNLIADGTVGARAIVADEAFFEDIQVNTIYNHGGTGSNYKFKIDLVNGSFHIRGGN